jgi:2Fe-2S ferredoxin
MITVTFIQPDGSSRTVDMEMGGSVMEGAVAGQVPGVEAECGGNMQCSTCHCYVDPQWYERLPSPAEEERMLIEFAWEPGETSRLTCQLWVTGELNGLVLRVPAQQL